MSFTYTDEQSMLDETLTGLLGELRPASATSEDYRCAIWQGLVDLGLTAMPYEEEDGGLGSSTADQMVVQRAIGRTALDLPFLSNSIVGGGLLAGLAADGRGTSSLLPHLVAGDNTIAFAHFEPRDRYRQMRPATTALATADGFVLTGTKSKVLHGDHATHLLVSATLAGTDDIGIFIVPAEAKGISITSNRGHVGAWASNICFETVTVEADALLASQAQAAALIGLALDLALVATVHEAVGAMERLHTLTVEYLKLRKQFGVELATFQSLQHKAVDMYVELEQARSMAIYCNAMLAAEATDRHAAAVAAKMQINGAARFIGEMAIQLHGAIGMTMESETGPLFRRLTALQFQFADRDQCLAELGSMPISILEN